MDASKNVSLAAALAWSPRIDLRVVHLVRDVPGVAHSWTKHTTRPETDGTTVRPTYPPWLVGVWWLTENALFHRLARHGVPMLRLRYEDLVHHVPAALDAVRRFAGLPPASYPFLDHAIARVGRGHTFGGNPMRFTPGPLPVSIDTEWQQTLRSRSRRIVTTLGLPLRIPYRYLNRPGVGPAPG